MKLLLDTHFLLWSAARTDRVPAQLISLLEDEATEPIYSVVSLWEIAIKTAARRGGFDVDVAILRMGLLANGWFELPFQGDHAIAVSQLPDIHGDPFDRALVAQAIEEDIVLATVDRVLQRYPAKVRLF